MINRLKEIRLNKGITQQELADKLHMTKANICMIENNKRKMSASCLVDLAIFFNVPIDYLLGISDNPIVLDKNQIKIINEIKDLSIDDINEILKYIEFLKMKGMNKNEK